MNGIKITVDKKLYISVVLIENKSLLRMVIICTIENAAIIEMFVILLVIIVLFSLKLIVFEITKLKNLLIFIIHLINKRAIRLNPIINGQIIIYTIVSIMYENMFLYLL